MQTHSRDQKQWLKAFLSMGVALALFNSAYNSFVCEASPVSQLGFRDNHVGYNGQEKQILRAEGTTVLDVLGARPEFSKLLELIRKDRDLMNALGDPSTQPTLFAPTNEAFDSVSDIDYPTHDVLMYHIAPRPYNSSRLHDEFVIKTMFDSPGLDNAPQRLRISLVQPGIPSTSAQALHDSLWRHESEDTCKDTNGRGRCLFVNRAKVTMPDLAARSGGMVHGVNRIIRPPGETILDEIMRRGMHFTYLTKAWDETGVNAYVRDGKSMTLFAAPDKAWKALPKKLLKWIFSDRGREHLKIFAMYQIANKNVYTPDILHKDEGKSTYPEIDLQTLLHSHAYELHVQGKARKSTSNVDKIDYKSLDLIDLIETLKLRKLFGLGDEKHRHHRREPKNPSANRRDDIFINGKVKVMQGLENWIAGNGVIHLVDKVLMPPRRKGCEDMTVFECSAWETMWDLGNVGLDDTVEWIDDMTLYDNIEGAFGDLEILRSADEDLAEMDGEDSDDY
ncbi:hypothetical protein BGZ95_008876 [Linnemannia exigua]|uniref:FAS1 domain-containing protein n=1 Tax=Linnemannia exigua TaxID=604196 RepID=A0AAD4DFB5_9FUNG|nr:hypothetical protein BGZ95_008876 [Linnemannia exigua]